MLFPFPSGHCFIIWQQKQTLINLHRCAFASLHVRNSELETSAVYMEVEHCNLRRCAFVCMPDKTLESEMCYYPAYDYELYFLLRQKCGKMYKFDGGLTA